VRPESVVLLAPHFQHDLRLFKRVEYFSVQLVVAHLPVEALVMLIIFSASVALAGGEAWNGTSLGMSVAEIEKSTKLKLKKIVSEKAYEQVDETHTGGTISISGAPFSVTFSVMKGLSLVRLTSEEKRPYSTFLKIKSMLQGKYGKPSLPVEKVKDGLGSHEKLEWLTKTTHITVLYADMSVLGPGSEALAIVYEPRIQSGSNKL